MPWTSNDAERHTHKATTAELKELWAKVANESLERSGNEGRAIREANAVVARQAQIASSEQASHCLATDYLDEALAQFGHSCDE
jgi:hypothetical protein